MQNANSPANQASTGFSAPTFAAPTPPLAAAKKLTPYRSDVPNLEELLAWVVRAQNLKLITIKEVCERTGMGASFVHAEVAAGRFPKPVKLGASKSRRAAARFVNSEISEYIEQCIAQRDEATPTTGVAT